MCTRWSRILVFASTQLFFLTPYAPAQQPPLARLIEKERVVESSPPPSQPWIAAEVGRELVKREKVGVRDLSRAAVRLSNEHVIRLNANSEIVLLPSLIEGKPLGLELQKGEIYLHSRGLPAELGLKTPVVEGTPHGTQFRVRVEGDGTTTFTMFEGEVELTNEHGKLRLGNNEQAVVEPGRAPRRTAVIEAKNTIQWCLYYPGVVDVQDLGLSPADLHALHESINNYDAGDLLGALDHWPAGRRSGAAGVRVFRAMVLLAVGQTNEARRSLAGVPAEAPGRRAIEEMIDAVNFIERPEGPEPQTASEWLAHSYYEQSRSRLESALEAARMAATLAPSSGYAAARVADLEFSFGRTATALGELDRGMKLSPRNAQAHALRGFLLSAQNRIDEASAAFEKAIRLDGALGNAWLGRGLCAIRQGRTDEGRRDLQTATVLEPNRAIFHSYLGKAASQAGLNDAAWHDFDYAKQVDPRDPTPWLYSALQKSQENRYNGAIDDLARSVDLNENRRVYRSRFLLDQDLSVRNANLAALYRNNSMTDLSVREATRAVENNYTNASAHLFLANSFDALRDPTRIQLRYETAWFNELLLANLLSPVGGGPLSQFVSQQEYSKLLEEDGIGGFSLTDWRSDGRFQEQASLYGTSGNFSYGLDYSRFQDDGSRPNNEDSRDTVYWQAKYQATPDDVFYTFGQWQDKESGDLSQNYFNRPGSLQFEEAQKPGQVLFGWNHRWAPGVHTLVLGGRLAAEQTLTDPTSTQALLFRQSTPALKGFFNRISQDPNNPPVTQNPDGSLSYSDAFLKGIQPFTGRGPVTDVFQDQFSFLTRREFEIYTGEIQHIWETSRNTLIAGARWQGGTFDTDATLTLINSDNQFLFSNPAADQDVETDFQRQTVYGYDFIKLTPWLTVIGGATWDRIEHPENFRNPPVSERTTEDERFSGKAGFTLSPGKYFTMRGVYSEAMGGVSFEDSVRLEPVQLAGFNQSYRTAISESLVGSVEAPVFKNMGLSVEGELPTRTWWSASLNIIEQDVDRTVGAFDGFLSDVFPAGAGYVPGGTTESLSYRESVFSATLNHLIGEELSVGAGYRYTRARLNDRFPQLEPVSAAADRTDEATLQEIQLFANWNSPTGLFARAGARWYFQNLESLSGGGESSELPGDNFWQFDAFVGYRFHRNQCEVSIGVQNITDTDYNLSPLTYIDDIPRERTFAVRCRLGF